jgi:glycosyltransferase involved in cell wall biosynthesis
MTKSSAAAPAITVLMSCYNAARWLDESVNSVLKQTFTDFEFIIVDDGSRDSTPEILRKFAEADRRIHVISKANTGCPDSLNAGIQKARGEWIARLDADDICEPARLEKQWELAKKSPKVVYIGTGHMAIDQHGNPVKVYRYPAHHASLLSHLLSAQRFPSHSSAFYRTRTVQSLGGYRTRIHRAEDHDLWLRLSEAGDLTCLAAPLVRVRRHPDQLSNEEAGRPQWVDSRVATTSYWLRHSGCLDPVSDDETRFHAFRAFIEERLEEEDLFANEVFRSKLIRVSYGSANFPAGVFKAMAVSLQHPAIALRLIRQILIGDHLPRRLAREWIDQSDELLKRKTNVANKYQLSKKGEKGYR